HQTQVRLREQLVALRPEDWIELTTPEEDFRRQHNVNAFLTEHAYQKVLCVIKKNSFRLRHLLEWLESAEPSVLRTCPALVIDDEADQASINTAATVDNPSMINRRLRQVLRALPKAAYVGYTATPFANVLIDPSVEEDLYPRDFIIDLPKPP